jgi:hypothetical protein
MPVLESASVCVVEAGCRIVREAKVASEPDALITWFGKFAVEISRIGSPAARFGTPSPERADTRPQSSENHCVRREKPLHMRMPAMTASG